MQNNLVKSSYLTQKRPYKVPLSALQTGPSGVRAAAAGAASRAAGVVRDESKQTNQHNGRKTLIFESPCFLPN
jgi:hypothetical protein